MKSRLLENHRALALACLLASIAAQARANDGVMGGAGSDLVPMKTSDVSMVSEDIQLTFFDEYWQVEADYVFRNNEQSVVALQLGFPEYRCEHEEADCKSADTFHFEDMKTLVRGAAVKHKKGRVKGDHAWAPRLGSVWLFDVKFAPAESVTIRHTYRVPTDYDSVGGRGTRYVTRTGALWAGPIETATFRVRVPLRAIEFIGPEQLKPSSSTPIDVEGRKLVEVKYVVQGFAPDHDLSFYFLERHGASAMDSARPDLAPQGPAHAGLASNERCPSFLALWELGEGALRKDEPAEARKARKEREARELEDAARVGTARRICEATVYAKYGKRFDDDRLNRYFYGEQGFTPTAWPHAFMKPNPDFDPSWLGDDDKATLELIARLPDRELVAAPAPAAPAAQANNDALAPSPTAASPAATPPSSDDRGCAVAQPRRSTAGSVFAACWLLALACLACRRDGRRPPTPAVERRSGCGSPPGYAVTDWLG